jgi:transcription elongation factor Elf1
MNTEKYNCNHCNKTYSSYKTLWTHNKNHHNGIKTEKTIIEEKPKKMDTEYSCIICNKIYKYKQGKYRHEKTCNGIKQPDREFELEKTKLERTKIEQGNLDKEQENLDKEQNILELKIKLQGMTRIDTKTFKYMNKMLMDRSITNNNTQNINFNFPNILSIGKENVVDYLSMYDKKLILDSRHNSLDKIVEIVHCGTHNLFKNIVITNLKDKFAYRYDETKGYFITGNKSDLLDDLMTFRMMDLETIYDELSTANKIDSKTKKIIQEFLDKMENEEVFLFGDVEYPNFKSYKIDKIKILLYNNQDKITKDIALLIGDKKENEIPKNEIIS